MAWRAVPGHVWRRAEPRRVTGFTYTGRNAAATLPPNLYSYIFEFNLRRTLPRAGGGLDPDLASTPLLTVPRSPGGGASQPYRVSSSIPPVTLDFHDVSMTLTYAGGENDDKDANATRSPSQATASSAYEGDTPWVTDGHFENGVLWYNTEPFFALVVTIFEDAPVCRIESDWGKRRLHYGPPEPNGYSISTYYAPLGSAGAYGDVTWDVYAGSAFAGHLAVPLTNLGSIWQGSLPFAGTVLEIDPTDPLLTVLHPWGIPVQSVSWEGAQHFPLSPTQSAKPSAPSTSCSIHSSTSRARPARSG
jgi:hypothetical protein